MAPAKGKEAPAKGKGMQAKGKGAPAKGKGRSSKKSAPASSSTRRRSGPARKRAAGEIVERLKEHFPDAQCALHFDTPLQLLVATILSAQCTDERVNKVTARLFAEYPAAEDLARLPQADLERLIQSTGFFRNKAQNIRACCQQLVDRHGGEVPQDLATLVELPGVGRKTANVVLGTAFGLPTGVVVDTHVKRIAQRLGLTEKSDPVKIEQDLMEVLPEPEWIGFSHRVIFLGRQICKARKPNCSQCFLRPVCPQIGVTDAG